MKNKKIIITLLVIIIVILVIIGFIFLNKDKTKPEDILKTYMSYVLDKNYEGMYDLTTQNTKKETYITRNKNIYEGIEVSNIKINIVKTLKNGNSAEVIYTTVMDTLAGEISFSNTTYFEKYEDTYKIKWTSNDIFPSLKEEYKIRVNTLTASRGEILDREGNVLAGKQTVSQIGFVPGKINSETKTQDIETVANLLDITVDSINNNLSASYVKDDTFVPLKTVLKSETELKNKLLEIKGIKIIDSEERIYPLGEATSQLLGYVQTINQEELEQRKSDGYNSNSIIGKTGLEKIYEDRLRGINGAEIYMVDENESKIKTLAKQELKNGETIKLTIDSKIQQKVYDQFKQDKSANIVIQPKTGEILALVSTPTYNSNDFSLGMTTAMWTKLTEDEGKPLYNRFLASYAPGSSFKPVTAGIGLSTNSFTQDEDFGKSGTKWQNDSSWGEFYVTTLETYSGTANLKNALIYSDNIYFAKAALKIGKENFANNLKKIKFNEEIQTPVGNVESSYSNAGTFSTETQLANSGYGQAEVLVNPIHMAMIYSSFVNDGNMVNTYIEYKDKPNATYFIENAFTKEAANIIKEDLIQVVENPNGTAHSAKIEGLTLAGKTGTAEIKSSKDDKQGSEIGWFNCFIVDEESLNQMLVVSMVEDVQGRGGSHYVVDKVKTLFE